MFAFPHDFIIDIGSQVGRLALWFAGLALLFTLIEASGLSACNEGQRWWRSKWLASDLAIGATAKILAPAGRIFALALLTVPVTAVPGMKAQSVLMGKGDGLFGHAPLALQIAVYLIGTDFFLYWTHRLFHGRVLWPFHAVHHTPRELHWTCTYRTHPVNAALAQTLVQLLMIELGVPPWLMLALVPFDIVSAAFVHANLDWTLGPLKYVVASPVFHRWHHTLTDEGGNMNFAPTFSIWDVMFGTFYMPKGRLPERYGTDADDLPETLIGQIATPFVLFWNELRDKPAPSALSARTELSER